MAKKLFVGGLAYSVTSDELREIFSKFGKVLSCDVIMDRFTNQSKGFAFVEMENNKEADEAIAKLNDTDIGGRKVAVSEARPREENTGYGNQNRGQGGGRNDFGRGRGRRNY
jgi:RNA recognition motif-containing protein